MRDRLEPILKGACIVLAGVLVLELGQRPRGGESIAELRVPEIHIAEPKPESGSEPAPGMPPGFMPPGMPPGMPGGPMGPGRGGPALEPELQARVDTILASQLFGAIPQPPPMALMGIAGDLAMLRAPNGQTGLIAEGDTLGGVKLLKIGTNRILIEHEGSEKELTLFSGYGGESLLNQEKGKPGSERE